MKTVVTVTGIRPDFIRMSEVFRKLDQASWCNHIIVHTGQHYDKMRSSVFFDELGIRKPDHNLRIGAPGKTHYQQQAELNCSIIELLQIENISPDIVLFLGDSNSVLASVPLRKEGIKVGHIEAGMRSYDERMLEEINRKVCDHTSNYLFTYHKNYKKNLLSEGIDETKIFITGNTIVEPLSKIALASYGGLKSHILLDIHRPENFQDPSRMQAIINFARLASFKAKLPIKMLKFSRTMEAIYNFNINILDMNPCEPMGYKKFVQAMQDSLFIISDSGTAQEEPALLKIPVIVPRDFTERPESMANNNSWLLLLDFSNEFNEAISWAMDPGESCAKWLGDGIASTLIVDTLESIL